MLKFSLNISVFKVALKKLMRELKKLKLKKSSLL